MADLSTTVVICCYTLRRWNLLTAAVLSVRRQTWPPTEILLVVDHCPALYQRARRQLRGVRVLTNDGPQGLSGARNTGVTAARGDVVAFLDDDAAADPDWLARLLGDYADPQVLGVGGAVTPNWVGGRPGWFPAEFDWVVGCSHPALPAAAAPVRNFVGANMSFRREPLADLGGFRSELGRIGTRPVGCEETELCIRLTTHHPQAVLLYQPAAEVRHHVPPDRQSFGYFRARCWAEGMSKAVVATLVGARDALSTERDYVIRVLPRGIARAAADGVRHHDPRGLLRVGALLAGVVTTGAGYAAGWSRRVGSAGSAQRKTAAGLAPLLLGMLLWVVSLRGVDLRAMTDLGLVSVLPVIYWIGLALIVAGAAVAIHRGGHGWLLVAYMVGLIVVLHATPAILYGPSLRYSWAWKHVGIIDYIVRHGGVDPGIGNLGAYQAWPGFFALNAVIVKAAGFSSALSYAGWAPPVNELLALVPLRLIFGALARDRRQIWLALLIFYLGNWVGQDYFSPQAFAYLLQLVVLAICLRHLPARVAGKLQGWRRLFGGQVPGQIPVRPVERRVLLAVLALLMLAIVSSHQLTPFMLLITLTVLVLGRHVGPAWLPALLAALTVGWILLVATPWLGANLPGIISSIGHPLANTTTTFVTAVPPSLDQAIVNDADRGLTVGIGLLAAIGWLRAGRTGTPRRLPALLAASPLPLLAANDYGGEMLFRVYLFALPFLALLAAATIYPRASRRRGTVLLPLLLAVTLVIPFCFAYYGKEKMNYFTPDEIAASHWLYDHAPAGSLVLAASANYPWAFTHYNTYTYLFLEDLPPEQRRQLATDPVGVLIQDLGRQRPAFVVLTRSQILEASYTGTLPAGAISSLEADLPAAPGFRTVYRNTDATIFELAGPG